MAALRGRHFGERGGCHVQATLRHGVRYVAMKSAAWRGAARGLMNPRVARVSAAVAGSRTLHGDQVVGDAHLVLPAPATGDAVLAVDHERGGAGNPATRHE